MKKFSLFLLISVFSLGLTAQNSVSPITPLPQSSETQVQKATDEVLTIKETEFDFGKIPQGKPVTHDFEVLNNGKDSLKIENVQASCGCTTPEWDKDKTQAPGEKTRIKVGYNAASEGPFTKTITINYNGAQTRQITIKGEVWKTPVSSAPENKALETLKN